MKIQKQNSMSYVCKWLTFQSRSNFPHLHPLAIIWDCLLNWSKNHCQKYLNKLFILFFCLSNKAWRFFTSNTWQYLYLIVDEKIPCVSGCSLDLWYPWRKQSIIFKLWSNIDGSYLSNYSPRTTTGKLIWRLCHCSLTEHASISSNGQYQALWLDSLIGNTK